MGGLAHYLEKAGIPTTQISLVRLHTEKMSPPRALWVPFELGRPFGVPGDAGFQRRVVIAALQLLERPSGPVLEDFPDDAPRSNVQDWSCPIGYARSQGETSTAEGIANTLSNEIGAYQPWYDRGVEARSRTTVGLSGLDFDEIAQLIANACTGQALPHAGDASAWSEKLKLAVEDLKAFYSEAMLAQPGVAPGPHLEDWFWDNTVAGKTLLELRETLSTEADPALNLLGKLLLVPHRQLDRID